MSDTHNTFMKKALELAASAGQIDEVPVGCVITYEDRIIAEGFNQRESSARTCAHAEILAIEAANRHLGAWRLSQCDLYVTLEPCVMCAGAIYQARIARVFYGAKDPKGGAMGSLYNIHSDHRLNHQTAVIAGIMQNECAELLTNFFRRRRSSP